MDSVARIREFLAEAGVPQSGMGSMGSPPSLSDIPQRSHLIQPCRPLLLMHRFYRPNDTRLDRADPGEPKNITLQTLETMRKEEPPVDERGHAHGDNDAG